MASKHSECLFFYYASWENGCMTWNKEKKSPALHSSLWFSAMQVHRQRQRPKRGAALHFYLACRSPRSVTFCSPPSSLLLPPCHPLGFCSPLILCCHCLDVFVSSSLEGIRAAGLSWASQLWAFHYDSIWRTISGGRVGVGSVCRGETRTLVWSQKRL